MRLVAPCWLGIALGAVTVCAGTDPVPAFDRTHIDVGTLVYGDTALLTYPFTNTSVDTLVVDEVQTSCGCIGETDMRGTYAPGARGTVAVTFLSSGQVSGGRREIGVKFRAAGDPPGEDAILAGLSFSVDIRHEVRFRPNTICGRRPVRARQFVVPAELVNAGDSTIEVVGLTAEPESGLQVLSRPLPALLRRGEGMTFALAVMPGLQTATAHRLTSRVSAHTRGTKYTRHDCTVHLFTD